MTNRRLAEPQLPFATPLAKAVAPHPISQKEVDAIKRKQVIDARRAKGFCARCDTDSKGFFLCAQHRLWMNQCRTERRRKKKRHVTD